MKLLFWRSLVVLFLVLGFIGALLPGMPTTVFLILAAWAASKGWPEVDAWLLNHPKYGVTLDISKTESKCCDRTDYKTHCS